MADTLRFVIIALAAATIAFAVVQFIARWQFGKSGQIDVRLGYLLSAYLLTCSALSVFTMVSRLDTEVTWRIYLAGSATLIGAGIVAMMLRGDFKRYDEKTSTPEVDELDRDEFPRRIPHTTAVRRRAGRR